MATTEAGEELTQQYYSDQLALRALLIYELIRYWPVLDPTRLDGTSAIWLELVIEAIERFFSRSAQGGAQYYDDFRAAEIGRPLDEKFFTKANVGNLEDLSRLVQPVREQIRTSMIVTGPIAIKQRVAKGMDLSEAVTRSFTQSTGAASRLATAGGSSTIERLVVIDAPVAKGWIRRTGPNPCYFCAMLATRSGRWLYRTRETASFHPHEHCACQPQPVFSRTAPLPAQNREFEQLYKDATKDPGDQTLLNAFRSAYEAKYGRWTPSN